ncbi:MAG: hypothetical protein R2851_20995 [Caldilineaceae bacterium]
MLAEMAIRMADTALRLPEPAGRAQHLRLRRTLYPGAPYYTLFGSNDCGLLEEAEAAKYAKEPTADVANTKRTFDEKRSDLQDAIQELVTGRDESLQAVAGCDYNDFNTDSDAYYACIEDNIAALEACDATMASSASLRSLYGQCHRRRHEAGRLGTAGRLPTHQTRTGRIGQYRETRRIRRDSLC